MSAKLENVFRRQLCDSAKENFGRKIHIHKNHGNASSAGLPDLFVQYGPLGGVHLELKADGELFGHRHDSQGTLWNWGRDPTSLQQYQLRAIHNAGGTVGVVLFVKAINAAFSIHGNALMKLFDEKRTWNFTEVMHGHLTLADEFKVRWWKTGPKNELELLELLYGRRMYSVTQTQASFEEEQDKRLRDAYPGAG